ncbi:hypothetical protein GPECTOR_7g1021 [Gonium pectorale]|uniref:Pherophorin domain-containing protein n=1 Tax=Gonium pectorale TaxID=33097 RepID=A0A150GUX6_GONPE|nr:hypothetical protein GPECTOR_7g1021 [Gonium pectorale]|eukprot:KXZ53130.1 hypothetical protein GPECTOR_7g1021 [Gonium pectorale]
MDARAWNVYSCCAGTRHRCSVGALLCVLAAALLSVASAGPLAGTRFPFESCIKTDGSSRFSAYLKNNTYDVWTGTSRVCIGFEVAPADACDAGPYRCCNTNFNKFKFYPSPNCRRAMREVFFQLNTGPPVKIDALYYEDEGEEFIGKVTTLPFTLENADGGSICWTLVPPCGTLYEFTHEATRDKGLFEIALYDRKVDNYEVRTGPGVLPTGGRLERR